MKLNIQKTKIMASDPIISRQIERGKAEAVTDFIFLGSRIIVDGDCSHEIKTLASYKKSLEKLSILKSRAITLLTKVCIIKAIVFPLIMYECESWSIKKAKHQRRVAFELWCWRRLLRDPLDSKEIKPVNHKGNKP